MPDETAAPYVPVGGRYMDFLSRGEKVPNARLSHKHYQGLCGDCGALVGDRQQHDEWHERLENVARNAASGERRTRRIG